MNTNENDEVARRLRKPAQRHNKSKAGFITQYLPEIAEARRNGKTWEMIGQDLQGRYRSAGGRARDQGEHPQTAGEEEAEDC